MGVENTLLDQKEMGVGDMQMQRHVKGYRGKGKEDEHTDLNLDVYNEEEDIEKEEEDIEKEVGIEEQLDEGMRKDCGMDMEAKNRNYPLRKVANSRTTQRSLNYGLFEKYNNITKSIRSTVLYPNQTKKILPNEWNPEKEIKNERML